MAYQFAFEAVDKIFRNITKVNKPFGNIIFIMDRDFRQILSVVI